LPNINQRVDGALLAGPGRVASPIFATLERILILVQAELTAVCGLTLARGVQVLLSVTTVPGGSIFIEVAEKGATSGQESGSTV